MLDRWDCLDIVDHLERNGYDREDAWVAVTELLELPAGDDLATRIQELVE